MKSLSALQLVTSLILLVGVWACDDNSIAQPDDMARTDILGDGDPQDMDRETPGDVDDATDVGDVSDMIGDVHTDIDVLEDTADADVVEDVSADVVSMCQSLDPAGYGACATPLGYGFTGSDCEPISGCDCGSDCDQFSDYRAACLGDCLGCDESRLAGAGIGGPPRPGGFCDSLEVCVDVVWHRDIEGLIPGAECETASSLGCPDSHHCVIPQTGDWYADVCKASRFSGVTSVVCVVLGP